MAWWEQADAEGNKYYYNDETQECVWDKPAAYVDPAATAEGGHPVLPAELAAKMQAAFEGKLKKKKALDPEMQKKVDAAKKAHMLSKEEMQKKVNAGEEHWVEVYDPASDAFYYYGSYSGETTWEKPEHYVMAAEDDLMIAVIKIQSMWRGKIARGEVTIKKVKKEVEKTGSIWTACEDDNGHIFYWNSKTNAMQWDKPADFDGDDKKPSAEVKDFMKKAMAGKVKKKDKKVATAMKAHMVTHEEMLAKVNAGEEHWVEVYDSQHEAFYYYGSYSGEMTWEKPKHYVMAADDDLMHAVIKIQSMWRGKIYRRKMKDVLEGKVKKTKKLDPELQKKLDAAKKAHMLSAEELKAKVEGGEEHWVEVYDSEHDAFYYYGSYTGEMTWEKPEHYVMAAEDDLMIAVIKIQSMWRGKIARGEVTVRKVKKETENGPTWHACEDEGGHIFYWNSKTDEMQWDKPADFDGEKSSTEVQNFMKKAMAGKVRKKDEKVSAALKAHMLTHQEMLSKVSAGQAEHWVEVYDPEHEAFYYYGSNSGEMTWEKPEHYVMAADDDLMHAVIKIQSMWRGRIARGEVTIKKKTGQMWIEAKDEDSGHIYYWHKDTGECVWEKPKEFVSGGTEPEGAALKMKMAFEGRLKMHDKDVQEKLEAAKKVQAAMESRRNEHVDGGGHHWVEAFDSASESFYYYDTVSHETVWEKPEHYVMAAEDDLILAVIKIQTAWRKKLAKGLVKKRKVQQQLWVATVDSDSGHTYYYNTKTQEVTWQAPPEFVAGNKGDEEILASARKAMEGKLKKVDLKLDAKTKAAHEAMKVAHAGMSRQWASAYDCDRDMFYYYDMVSQEVTWEKPSDFVEHAEFPEMQAAIKIQGMWRAKVARGEVGRMREFDYEFELEGAAVGDKGARRASIDAQGNRKPQRENAAKLGANQSDADRQRLNQARSAIVRLNEEEIAMRKEMEGLRRAKEQKKREKRLRKKKEKEARLKAEAEERKVQKELAAEAWRKEQLEKRRAMKARKEEHLDARHKQRETQMAEMKEKLEAKKAKIDALKKAEEDRQRVEREKIVAARHEREKKRKEQFVADCETWRKTWVAAEDAMQTMLQERNQRIEGVLDIKDGVLATKAARRDKLTTLVEARTLSSKDTFKATQRNCKPDRFQAIFDEAIATQSRVMPPPGTTKWEVDNRIYSSEERKKKAAIMGKDRVVNAHNALGETNLHIACWQGNMPAVEYLLENGARVNEQDSTLTKTTPLHEAARGGWANIVKLLMESGAEPMALDMAGETPLHWAFRNGHTPAAKQLLKIAKWRELFEVDNDRLRRASYYGRVGSVRVLVEEYDGMIKVLADEEQKAQEAIDMENKKYREKKKRGFKKVRRNIKGTKGMGKSTPMI
jgi:hypothetical protein